MIDYWKLAKEFKQGDAVQKVDSTRGSLSPFVGQVTASHPGLGVVDVQWPFGNQREFPDELVKVNPAISLYLPPSFDQSYASYDITKARKASSAPPPWLNQALPPTFYQKLASHWHKGAGEVLAYDGLYREFAASGVEDDAIRSEVAKFYTVASNLMDLRVQQFAVKSAAYWMAQNRTYRATSNEITNGKPSCPKCGSMMKKTTYKMAEGSRMRLFACPKDLFLLKPTDILGPGGDPVGW